MDPVPAQMHGWVNLLTTENMNTAPSLAAKLQAWERYQIPSLFGPVFNFAEDGSGNPVWKAGALQQGWRGWVERLVKAEILPHFGPTKALRGVVLGDEL